jgi:outer membrane lipoprotein SlyB
VSCRRVVGTRLRYHGPSGKYRNFGQPADFNKEIKMWNEKTKLASVGIMVAALTACGTTGMAPSSSAGSIPVTTTTTSSASGYGVVQSIEAVPRQQVAGVGLGTVAGAVVGGLLGNQVGSGNGRTAATVAGVAGGAMVGNQMQRNSQAASSGGSDAYRVTVRMDNGAVQTLAMDTSGGLQVGERVRVQNGNIVERLR